MRSLIVVVVVLTATRAEAQDVGVRGEVAGLVGGSGGIRGDDGGTALGLGVLATVRLGRWFQLGGSLEGAHFETSARGTGMARAVGWIGGVVRRGKYGRAELLLGAGEQRFADRGSSWYSARFTVGARLAGYLHLSPNVDVGGSLTYNRDFGGDDASNVVIVGLALAFHTAYY